MRVAKVTKANDQPEGELLRFSMASETIGIDEDGESITVGILAEHDASHPPTKEWPANLTRLREAVDEATIDAGFDYDIPRGPTVIAISLEIVRSVYRQKHVAVSDDTKRPYRAPDSALDRDIQKASQMRLIGGAKIAGKQAVWVVR